MAIAFFSDLFQSSVSLYFWAVRWNLHVAVFQFIGKVESFFDVHGFALFGFVSFIGIETIIVPFNTFKSSSEVVAHG